MEKETAARGCQVTSQNHIITLEIVDYTDQRITMLISVLVQERKPMKLKIYGR